MDKEKKPSQEINQFVKFLEDARTAYEEAKKMVTKFDSMDRHIHWAHEFEFANNRNDRNRLATAYHNERLERRRYKNTIDLYEAVYNFIVSDYNKSTLKRLRGVIDSQEKNEKYLDSERVYKRGDSGDTD